MFLQQTVPQPLFPVGRNRVPLFRQPHGEDFMLIFNGLHRIDLVLLFYSNYVVI